MIAIKQHPAVLTLHPPPQRGPADAQNLASLPLVTLHRVQHLTHALLFCAVAGVRWGFGVTKDQMFGFSGLAPTLPPYNQLTRAILALGVSACLYGHPI